MNDSNMNDSNMNDSNMNASNMNDSNEPNHSPADNLLLAELADAVPTPPMPATLRAACLDLLTWRTIDAELAELLESSMLTGVRSDDTDHLTFEAKSARGEDDPTRIELSLGDRHGMVVGQITPPAAGDVTLQTGSGLTAASVDEAGRFTIPTSLRGMFRLRIELIGRRPLITSWTLA
jgi:hypothetical protein